MKISILSLLLFSLIASVQAQSSTKDTGPVIHDYGQVWDVPESELEIGDEDEFHLVFDIYSQSGARKC